MRVSGAATLGLLLASCASSRPTQKDPTALSSNAGTSVESAIVLKESNEDAGVAAEYRWLATHYPNYKRGAQGLINKNGHMYDRLDFTTSDGESKVVYFDITGFFGKL